MADEEKLGNEEQPEAPPSPLKYRLPWWSRLGTYVPDWIRVPFIRVSTRWKIRRIRSGIREYIRTYRGIATETDNIEANIALDQARIEHLQNAVAAEETEWFMLRASRQRVPVPIPSAPYWVGKDLSYSLEPDQLRNFKDAVIQAERETWKHRREWMVFISAVLFGVVGAVSAFYNILSTQRKLNDIQGKLNDTQSVLADTQGKLYDAQRKLIDLTEQFRRRELSAGKRGMIPRAR